VASRKPCIHAVKRRLIIHKLWFSSGKSGFKNLFALAENYPELKSNRNFLQLQEQLAEIEDPLQMARRYYNGATRNYNLLIESFPSNLVAGLFRLQRAEFFQIITATERTNPSVEV